MDYFDKRYGYTNYSPEKYIKSFDTTYDCFICDEEDGSLVLMPTHEIDHDFLHVWEKKTIKSIILAWLEKRPKELIIHGTYHSHQTHCKEEYDYLTDYYDVVENGGPFQDFFNSIPEKFCVTKSVCSGYDCCKNIVDNYEAIKFIDRTVMTHYFCSINDVPVIISPVIKTMRWNNSYINMFVLKFRFNYSFYLWKYEDIIRSLGLSYAYEIRVRPY